MYRRETCWWLQTLKYYCLDTIDADGLMNDRRWTYQRCPSLPRSLDVEYYYISRQNQLRQRTLTQEWSPDVHCVDWHPIERSDQLGRTKFIDSIEIEGTSQSYLRRTRRRDHHRLRHPEQEDYSPPCSHPDSRWDRLARLLSDQPSSRSLTVRCNSRRIRLRDLPCSTTWT